MHLISTLPGGWNPNDEGVFHVQQLPGDVLFLSAADSELSTANEAYYSIVSEFGNGLPSLRLANLTYFKQELTIDTYIEEVASKAKVIVFKLLGGLGYFEYLVDAFTLMAEKSDVKLIFLPGDEEPDLELMQQSNVSLTMVDMLWKYILAGGVHNMQQVLKLIFQKFFNKKFHLSPISNIPQKFLYHKSKGILSGKLTNSNDLTLIIAYRSAFVANQLEPIHELMTQLELKGLPCLSLFASGFREENTTNQLLDLLIEHEVSSIAAIVNTTSFSIHSFEGRGIGIFDQMDVPVIQAISASCSKDAWKAGDYGLPPTDVAINIALPEVDGKIITQAISFKEIRANDPLTHSELVNYVPNLEGCIAVSNHVQNWVRLRNKTRDERRIALILPNYPTRNSRLANGVGLDTPASTIQILRALKLSGYKVDNNAPDDVESLIDLVTSKMTNDNSSFNKKSSLKLSADQFLNHYNQLDKQLRNKIENQWGKPNECPHFVDGEFLVAGIQLGNIYIGVQPSRGYDADLQASYHSPDLPPTFGYLTYYFWLQESFRADAIVHVGKHGNLEWLPGKSVSLGKESCFPKAILSELPHFYPFIINDPGEGTQAKRRTHAVILDHLIPPMTRAESYGPLLQLELLIEEFYESALLDPKRNRLIKKKIEKLVNETHLQEDLNQDSKHIDELLEVIDGYLCELKESQIRGGLHIFGIPPKAEKLVDLIVALHRLPINGFAGITQSIATDIGLQFDPLNVKLDLNINQEIFGVPCRTAGKAIEQLEFKSVELIHAHILDGALPENLGATSKLLQNISQNTLPLLLKTSDEIDNLLHGLDGGFVPAGGSGAPTRGRLDILPTGRNFYSVDVRTVPSQSAYQLGEKSAKNIIDKYLQEHGDYPTSIGLSVWGTSTMRTGGDDIAQALALLGVRPIWQGANRRVKNFEVLSLFELRRPRIDVVLRISGFFRDAFPDVIALFNAAVEKVASLDEPLEENPIKARYVREKRDWLIQGLDKRQAHERSLYRVFGSKPGAYGAGLQGLIEGQNWKTSDDLAQAYINWGGFAYYGRKNQGNSAHETFKKRLESVEIVLQNQDNREHDLLDSDDYYQFQGGMTAAVKKERGISPMTYFGDHSRPEQPRIKSLKQEILKVYRSRVVNPKWLKGMREHGYKGAFEMSATLDYLFSFDATTDLVEDFMYEGVTEAYLMDRENKSFIEKHNPWALNDMAERMLEAIQRGMWKSPGEKIKEDLKDLFLSSEAQLEKN